MSVAQLGNSVYMALAGNGPAIAQIRTECATLALSIATDANATAQITSATINGQTFSGRATMTAGQRLQLLRWVLKCVENGGPISTTQITRF